ncbi:ABC transporter permease [Dactylosporangium darangshiense]|uniref:ABC transporter permease subunit n=1 Tax=Dactylosporangium darangshiense TaxID=579108 RepID=A0ABP8CX97_9ACTN
MTAALHAEWIKLRSLRSTYLTMLCAIVLGAGLGWLDTTSVARHWATMSAEDRAGFDAVGNSFTGLVFAQLAFGVLGVLAISTEYGTGMIRTTLAATPRRGTVFIAKALVVGAVTLVLGEAFAFGTFLLGQAMLATSRLDVSLTDPGVLRAVSSAGLYLWVVALVGYGVGALLRHTAGAIAVMFGVIFLAWPAARALESWSYLPDKLLLSNAADVLGQVHALAVKPRLPSLGLAYLDLLLYLVVALGLGAWRTSRDA